MQPKEKTFWVRCVLWRRPKLAALALEGDLNDGDIGVISLLPTTCSSNRDS